MLKKRLFLGLKIASILILLLFVDSKNIYAQTTALISEIIAHDCTPGSSCDGTTVLDVNGSGFTPESRVKLKDINSIEIFGTYVGGDGETKILTDFTGLTKCGVYDLSVYFTDPLLGFITTKYIYDPQGECNPKPKEFTVNGKVYEDLNLNGKYDLGEPIGVLPYINVGKVYFFNNPFYKEVGGGDYSAVIPEGTYQICVQITKGTYFFNTQPRVNPGIGGSYDEYCYRDYVVDSDVADLDFGFNLGLTPTLARTSPEIAHEGDIVSFELGITNNTNSTISKVLMEDGYNPEYLELASASKPIDRAYSIVSTPELVFNYNNWLFDEIKPLETLKVSVNYLAKTARWFDKKFQKIFDQNDSYVCLFTAFFCEESRNVGPINYDFFDGVLVLPAEFRPLPMPSPVTQELKSSTSNNSCTASSPTAPNFSAREFGGRAFLTWDKVANATHYMVQYGTKSGVYTFGVPSTGNVDHFEVGGLTAGNTYYFRVAGVNDCMGGSWSKEVAVRMPLSIGVAGVLGKEVLAKSIDKVVKSASTISGLISNAHDITKLMKKGYSSDWHNKFGVDANSNVIPDKVKEVYSWSYWWNPKYFPEDYLECTAFVYMVYNMSGVKLPDLGNAKTWVNATDVFDVFSSGKSSESIQVGDIIVWDDGPYGHVGVVSKVDNKKHVFDVSNANSIEPTLLYRWKDEDRTIVILDKDGKEVKWRPDHWLRLK